MNLNEFFNEVKNLTVYRTEHATFLSVVGLTGREVYEMLERMFIHYVLSNKIDAKLWSEVKDNMEISDYCLVVKN